VFVKMDIMMLDLTFVPNVTKLVNHVLDPIQETVWIVKLHLSIENYLKIPAFVAKDSMMTDPLLNVNNAIILVNNASVPRRANVKHVNLLIKEH
jgi:hypothetical protein